MASTKFNMNYLEGKMKNTQNWFQKYEILIIPMVASFLVILTHTLIVSKASSPDFERLSKTIEKVQSVKLYR